MTCPNCWGMGRECRRAMCTTCPPCPRCNGSGDVPDPNAAPSDSYRQIQVTAPRWRQADAARVAALRWSTSIKGNPWVRVMISGMEYHITVFPSRWREGEWGFVWSPLAYPDQRTFCRIRGIMSAEEAKAAALVDCGYASPPEPPPPPPPPPRPVRQAVPDGRLQPRSETPVRKIVLD